jgi:hypothetical protein
VVKSGFGVLSVETKVESLSEIFSRRAKLTTVKLRILPLGLTAMLLAANGSSFLNHSSGRYRSKGERAAQDSVRALGGRSTWFA